MKNDSHYEVTNKPKLCEDRDRERWERQPVKDLKEVHKFTEVEAEAFLRYLTKEQKKRLLTQAVARSRYGKQLFLEWCNYKKVAKP